jgi:gliding motility-associated-like protein
MKKIIHLMLGLSLVCTSQAQSYIINTIIGDGTMGYSGNGGPATAAGLNYPYAVAIDDTGNIYVADMNNNRIRKVNTNGIISEFAGNGVAGYGGDGGPATAAELKSPTDVIIDHSGNIYIADMMNERVRVINTNGIISTFAGTGLPGYNGDGIPATSAELYHPYFVALDDSGNIFISDQTNNRVRKVNLKGIILTVVGNGVAGQSGDGGPATIAEINEPLGLAVDRYYNLYVVDEVDEQIRKVNTNGIISVFAGNGTTGFAGDGGPATAAEFFDVWSITADRSGNFYVSDFANERIRKIDKNDTITTIAGCGINGFGGDGGPATAAKFDDPGPVSLDDSGNIYIPDVGNNRIRELRMICTTTIPVSISGITSIYIGDSAVLTVSSPSTSYIWSTGATTSSITVPSGNTTYSVIVHDSTTCKGIGTIATEISEGSIYIPEAFSPNGDGQNDVFYVRCDCIKTMNFIIFDRWGNKVFETNNNSIGWDGRYKGQPMNTGTYVYYITALLNDGTKFMKKGNVELVR